MHERLSLRRTSKILQEDAKPSALCYLQSVSTAQIESRISGLRLAVEELAIRDKRRLPSPRLEYSAFEYQLRGKPLTRRRQVIASNIVSLLCCTASHLLVIGAQPVFLDTTRPAAHFHDAEADHFSQRLF